jgi:transcriptional regulator GlxA family with amidase domain
MTPLRIGFLAYDQVNALDLVGPAEAFATAAQNAKTADCYEVLIIGVTHRPILAESGIRFYPDASLQTAPKLDTLIVPGGRGIRKARTNLAIVKWLKARGAKTRRIVSVCTGIYGLAPTGLLDGRRVTTHWRYAADIAARFPKLKVEPNALFLKDGAFYTAAGVTAGIDLALALIEEDLGRSVALSVAREMVVYLRRPGGQEQFSEPLRFQTESIDRLSELASWIMSHPASDLSTDALARKACLSRRHFIRRFKTTFGQPPGVFVQSRRLDEARRRLCDGKSSIEAVGNSVGFKTSDAFRRAFTRRFRITPSEYQRTFGNSAST